MWIFGSFVHGCAAADFDNQRLDSYYPSVAEGHEEIYDRFLSGKLIYRPNPGSDVGMVTLPIRELTNPLEGTFDLSSCGDSGQYLSISTGYRKGKKPENKDRVEIWICPRFLIDEKALSTTAAHFKPIMADWNQEKAPVGLFWTNGWWDDLSSYDCLVMQDMDELSNGDLYKQNVRGWGSGRLVMQRGGVRERYGIRLPNESSYFVYEGYTEVGSKKRISSAISDKSEKGDCGLQ